MPRITISKGTRTHFIPEGQDDVPEAERFELVAEPLTLSEEEEVLGAITDDAKSANSWINKLTRTKVVGWKNTGTDWEKEWQGNLPDDVIVGIPFKVRAEFFSHLLDQAGLKAEAVVGESE